MAEAKVLKVRDEGPRAGALALPFRAYSFKLLMGESVQGHFAQCTGLRSRVEVIPRREDGKTVVRKLSGPVGTGAVSLNYGLSTSAELWEWFLASMEGHGQSKNVSVLMLGVDGITEVFRYELLECWLRDWECAAVDARRQQAALSRLVLSFEAIRRG
ncbi:phage tail protein [Stigmatella sp. ncwal1]|uniref:Phage tail protein n=1 Tax=Stigmatella ashevillensis TaxID=2995309 RepID=A0ABT5DLJ9_9BACT|nr:phage tail protein [Stigmatella ashevillena]MDC0713237.1 phage tail protein [Stigmatella ashevillena]